MTYVAASGFYACTPWLPSPDDEPHWHPESHPDDHRMGKDRNGTRCCLERGCPYLEREVHDH